MIPERYAPITYALFRIVFGFLFLCFGLQKMFGWFGGQVAAAGESARRGGCDRGRSVAP